MTAEREPPTPSALRASEAAFDEAAGKTPEEVPPATFEQFVLSLAHSAWVHLGDAPDPGTGRVEPHLPMARHTIDLLALLQDRTRGNLSGQEERLLDQALYDLRLRFVEVARGPGGG